MIGPLFTLPKLGPEVSSVMADKSGKVNGEVVGPPASPQDLGNSAEVTSNCNAHVEVHRLPDNEWMMRKKQHSFVLLAGRRILVRMKALQKRRSMHFIRRSCNKLFFELDNGNFFDGILAVDQTMQNGLDSHQVSSIKTGKLPMIQDLQPHI